MRQESIERYKNDREFAALVNQFYALLSSGDWTPTEIREAAMVAAMKQEMLSVRSIVLTREEFDRLPSEIKRRIEQGS